MSRLNSRVSAVISGSPILSASALAALQATLSAEDAAVYAYGVIGAQLSGGRRTRADAAYQAHRDRRGALQQRIIHVGDVLHVGHLLARVQPGSHQQIPGQERGRVTDVGGVIRGDTAGVQRGRSAWCSFS